MVKNLFLHSTFSCFSGVFYTPSINKTTNEYNEKADKKQRRRRRNTDDYTIDVDKVDEDYCVIIKPSPPTPAPTLGPGIFVDVPPVITNMSINYTLSITKAKCLFWNEGDETWSTEGCVVSAWLVFFP